MRSVVSLVCYDAIAIGELPMDLRMKIGECLTKVTVKLAHAGFVGRHVWLRCVIDEIVGEEFLEQLEVPIALDLFGIPTHHRFCRVGRSYAINASTLSGLEGVLDAPGPAPQDFSARIAIWYQCSVRSSKFFEMSYQLRDFVISSGHGFSLSELLY